MQARSLVPRDWRTLDDAPGVPLRSPRGFGPRHPNWSNSSVKTSAIGLAVAATLAAHATQAILIDDFGSGPLEFTGVVAADPAGTASTKGRKRALRRTGHAPRPQCFIWAREPAQGFGEGINLRDGANAPSRPGVVIVAIRIRSAAAAATDLDSRSASAWKRTCMRWRRLGRRTPGVAKRAIPQRVLRVGGLAQCAQGGFALGQIGINLRARGQLVGQRRIDLLDRQDREGSGDGLGTLPAEKSPDDRIQRDAATADPIGAGG